VLVVGDWGALDAVAPRGLVRGPGASAAPATAATSTAAFPSALTVVSARLLILAPWRWEAVFITAGRQRLVGEVVAEVAGRRAIGVAEL
jgi:hypothetical protein